MFVLGAVAALALPVLKKKGLLKLSRGHGKLHARLGNVEAGVEAGGKAWIGSTK
jgi:hypothetical protein